MRVEDVGVELLAEVNLRLAIVGVWLVLHDVEVEMVERAAHLIKLVLGLHQNLVEAVGDSPRLLLLGEGAKMPLSSPVAPRSPDPRVENLPIVEIHVLAQAGDQVGEL